MSPVKAPLASGWQSWAPRLSSPPLIRQAACAMSVAGGQTSSSAEPDSPASAACRMASISARDPDRPFIFQLPATSGRTPGVIQSSTPLGGRGCYHRLSAYAKQAGAAR